MERRTLLASIATGIGSMGATAAVLRTAEPAQATVSMGTLNIADDSITTNDGNISDVSATVSGSWSYELPGGNVDHWEVQLRVSDGNAWYTVGQTSDTNQYKQYSGQYSVSGSITDTEAFDVSFFSSPGPGQQTTVELPLQVRFRVMDTSGTELANTTVKDTASVVVGQTEIDASLYGEVSGEGSLNVK